MSSILLGSLAFPKSKDNNELNSTYHSDLENKMNIIERNQVLQDRSKPEYLNQFDELRFDNISVPVSVNESYTTINGVNTSLQRNLDFQRGFSSFQNTDMHYDVISREHFTHNNMVPNSSKRDFDINADRCQQKLETFTGSFSHYTPKKEKVPLFEPMADLTWTNGMPAFSGEMQNRYLPSNKNNYGNLPFQAHVKIRPGIDKKNQEGTHSVYRINPKTVDELRSDINKKVSYENKPIEAVKKGDMRAPDPNLTKFKLPDYREQKFSDLVPSKSHIEGPKQVGKYTNVTTSRNESENYKPGPAVNTSQGEAPNKDKTRFEPSKKLTFNNDPTRAVSGVNNKPVLQNAKSFNILDNQRASTNIQYEGVMANTNKTYVVDYKDVPLTTMRELMIHGSNTLGVNGSAEKKNYVFSNDMVLPQTNRESTQHTEVLNPSTSVKLNAVYNMDEAKSTVRQGQSHSIVLNPSSNTKQNAVYNMDEAKSTVRQGQSHSIVLNPTSNTKQSAVYNMDEAKSTVRQGQSHSIVLNPTSNTKQTAVYNMDEAKSTVRQGQSHSIVLNPTSNTKQSAVYNMDEAKQTVKQTTLYTTPEMNVKASVSECYSGFQDDAKPTIKQTTIYNNYVGGSTSNTSGTYARDKEDRAKDTIRQTTEQTYYVGGANSNLSDGTYVRDKEDKAKATIRQTTEQTQYIGGASSNYKEESYVRDENDEARPTIKQTTIHNNYVGGTKSTTEGSYAIDHDDIARPTIKQTTIINEYVSGVRGEIDGQISHQAANNMCIDDRREKLTYNRPANGRKDANGPYIDRDNVRLHEPILFSYVPHPHKSLGHSVAPTTSRHTIETVYSMSKPVIETSSYYVNENFINTLKNNPLVNDIYHQKNV